MTKLNLSISEQLMYTTIMLKCECKCNSKTATGFFVNLSITDYLHIPVIVTNKHVIDDCTDIELYFNSADRFGNPANGLQIETTKATEWLEHDEIDLAILPVENIVRRLNSAGRPVYYKAFSLDDCIKQSKTDELTAIEDVIMIGYPDGIWDNINNKPIFRRGITATHPALNFKQEKQFLIDIACIPGSSGSPVILYYRGIEMNKSTGLAVGMDRIYLLGVLSEYRRDQVKTPINIGLVVKASQLKDFEGILENRGIEKTHIDERTKLDREATSEIRFCNCVSFASSVILNPE